MNREQIVKALECCHKEDVVLCAKCPYAKAENDEYCANRLLKEALALIRELTEENEQKDETIAGLIGTIKDAYGFAVRKMQERLKEYLDDFYNSDEDALLDVSDLIDLIAKEIMEGTNERIDT